MPTLNITSSANISNLLQEWLQEREGDEDTGPNSFEYKFGQMTAQKSQDLSPEEQLRLATTTAFKIIAGVNDYWMGLRGNPEIMSRIYNAIADHYAAQMEFLDAVKAGEPAAVAEVLSKGSFDSADEVIQAAQNGELAFTFTPLPGQERLTGSQQIAAWGFCALCCSCVSNWKKGQSGDDQQVA